METVYVVDSLSLINRPQVLEELEGSFYIHAISLKFLEHLKDKEDRDLLPYKKKVESALKIIRLQEGKNVTIFGTIPSGEELKKLLEDENCFFEVKLILKEVFQLRSSGKKVILIASFYDLIIEAQKDGIEVKHPNVLLFEKSFKIAAKKLKPITLISTCLLTVLLFILFFNSQKSFENLLLFGVVSSFWFLVIAGLHLWFKLGSYFLSPVYQVLSYLDHLKIQADSSYSYSSSSSWSEEEYSSLHSYYDGFKTTSFESISFMSDYDGSDSFIISGMDVSTFVTVTDDWFSSSHD